MVVPRSPTGSSGLRRFELPYRQVNPGAHFALKEPCAVTGPVPPAGSVPENVKVPLTSVVEEFVITNWPEVELNDWMVPPLV